MPIEDLPEDIGNDIVESDLKINPAGALISGGTFNAGSILHQRLHIVEWSCLDPIFTKIINKGIADFLKAYNRSDFDTVVLRVRSLTILHTHSSSGQSSAK